MDNQFTMIAVGIALGGLAFMLYQNNYNDTIRRMYRQAAVSVKTQTVADLNNPQAYDDSFIDVVPDQTYDNNRLLGR